MSMTEHTLNTPPFVPYDGVGMIPGGQSADSLSLADNGIPCAICSSANRPDSQSEGVFIFAAI